MHKKYNDIKNTKYIVAIKYLFQIAIWCGLLPLY